MIGEVEELIDQYRAWLRQKTSLREIGNHVEITTPYLDRNNDYLQIYVRPENGGFLLTDGGHIIQDLEISGCRLETKKRQELLNMTVNGFGVAVGHDRSLTVKASRDNFALRKHNLVQAMLAVNDLFYLAESTVTSLFYEDVVAWFDANDVRYTPKPKFTGKSGFDHLFDFVIPKSRHLPERIVQTINRPAKDTAQAVAFSWIDTKEIRPANSQALVLLNDSEHGVPEGVSSAMKNYGITPVPWSKREDYKEQFVN